MMGAAGEPRSSDPNPTAATQDSGLLDSTWEAGKPRGQPGGSPQGAPYSRRDQEFDVLRRSPECSLVAA